MARTCCGRYFCVLYSLFIYARFLFGIPGQIWFVLQGQIVEVGQTVSVFAQRHVLDVSLSCGRLSSLALTRGIIKPVRNIARGFCGPGFTQEIVICLELFLEVNDIVIFEVTRYFHPEEIVR